jgi:hypothetical protein
VQTYHRSPGFFFARGFLGVCGVSAILAIVLRLAEAINDDTLYREIRSRPRDAQVEDPALGLSLIDAAPTIVQGVVMLAVAWFLLIVVVDIQRGVPFDDRAAHRLRVSAVLVTAGIVAHAAVSAWADVEVLQAAPRGRGSDGYFYYFVGSVLPAAPWFLIAALLAVFAHAFREGQRLKHDSEGLV